MKKLALVFILLMILSFTGCMKEYQLTDQQSDMIAEYAAALILSSDKNYTESLAPMEELYEEIDSIPSPEVRNDSEPDDKGSSETNTDSIASPTEGQQDSGALAEDETKRYTFSKVVDTPNFDIQYQGFELCNTYPEEAKNPYFSLSPRKDNQLLVASFSIKNITDKKSRLNLNDPNITYQLIVNDKTASKPLLSLLENDLQYMDITIKAGETRTGLLIFEVPKDSELSSIYLNVKKGDKVDKIIMK